MAFLEQRLHATNADYININGERQSYTNHYNKLRDTIYSNLKEEKPLGKWLCGHKLGGSYADKLKITKPDEFDLVLHLSFPENDRIIVKRDNPKPGNVTLDMTSLLDSLQNQPHNEVTYTNLKKLVNPKKLLLEDKLQDLIQGAMTRSLNKMGNQITVDGKTTKIVYRRCGPAHTMFIEASDMKYSVDFVPAIRLNASQNILAPEQLKYFRNIKYWDAIPKPLKPFEPNNASFRASYYDAENVMLKNKNRLKDAIKFMKKFRDSKQNMNNLKSYYIKTVLLWQIEKRPITYWNLQLKDILIDMFRELKDYLAKSGRNGKLPFFWDPKLDLFAAFTQKQRENMYNTVVAEIYTLERGDGNLTNDIDMNVTSSFSTRAERDTKNGGGASNGQQAKPNQKPEVKKEASPPAAAKPGSAAKSAPAAKPASEEKPAPQPNDKSCTIG